VIKKVILQELSSAGCRVQGAGCRVQGAGAGAGVQGCRCRAPGRRDSRHGELVTDGLAGLGEEEHLRRGGVRGCEEEVRRRGGGGEAS